MSSPANVFHYTVIIIMPAVSIAEECSVIRVY